jgi:hypothetical protein
MKLIDCTVYTNKPKGGIPGTIPGKWEDRAWRPTEQIANRSDRKKTQAWAASLDKDLPVLVDLEPMLMAGGSLGDLMELLGDIRDTRRDLKLVCYVGGRLWPHIDKACWHPQVGGSNPQVLRAQVLIGELHRAGLCDGIGAEAYPPAMIALVHGIATLNEPLIARYMAIFFSNLRAELEPFLPHCPVVPVLGTQFVSGNSTTPMPASVFRRVRDECAARFDVAMVWGGIDFNEDGTQKRLRAYAENAAYFEETKPSLKLAGTSPTKA